MHAKPALRVENFGPVKDAQLSFGNLTVFVGPQATGKSIVLQLYKLILDKKAIHKRLRDLNIVWNRSLPSFLELYFGEGMASLYRENETQITYNHRKVDLA
ncbi:MAG: AAA family ATPase, partial [Fimbriimonadales bacterium]